MITFCGTERSIENNKHLILFHSIDTEKSTDVLAYSIQTMKCESFQHANVLEKDSEIYKGVVFPNNISYLRFINILIDSCKT